MGGNVPSQTDRNDLEVPCPNGGEGEEQAKWLWGPQQGRPSEEALSSGVSAPVTVLKSQCHLAFVLHTKCVGQGSMHQALGHCSPRDPASTPRARRGSGQHPGWELNQSPSEELGRVLAKRYPGPILSHSLIHHSRSCCGLRPDPVGLWVLYPGSQSRGGRAAGRPPHTHREVHRERKHCSVASDSP